MANKSDNDGCLGVAGLTVIVAVIGVLTMIPKAVWIGIGVLIGLGVLVWIGTLVAEQVARVRQDRASAREEARVAAATAERTRRVQALGQANAGSVESALAAVERIRASQAARDGWLGDIDFAADIAGIEELFASARELRSVADELGELPNPTSADRKLLDDAVTTAQTLDRAGTDRVVMISRCAVEADRIDESLREEVARARTEEQREDLQRRLQTMLYGVDATAAGESVDTVANQVLARVAGFRELKQQIVDARTS